ncbi:DNA polymerase IV [Candidatus Uhrbacteria bacterium]|nr:DNA polymerase IV [Candidatus Uhrbacteria bacterium]
MDSFFASCEQQANPTLRGIPIAVSGDPKSRTVVAAASKEAKKFGVKSAMTIGEARALCPQIQFVLGDPDKYVEVSRRVIAILGSFTPDVEVTSIDEAFLDVTGWCAQYVCDARYPHLLSPPIFSESGGMNQELCSPMIHDSLFIIRSMMCGAVHLAREIKRRIREEVGEWITCSVGIASNKRLAKLASEFDKPDGLVVVADDHPHALASHVCEYAPSRSPPERGGELLPGRSRVLSCAELLASLKLRDLCGIGARIEARLLGMGITTVAGLAAAPVERLVAEFGKYGHELHDMAIGRDDSPVVAEDAEPKSMGHAVTLPRDLRTLTEILPVVEELSEKVAARLRRHGYRGSTIHVTVRFRDFTSRSEQTTLHDATDDGLRISREVMRILQRDFLPLPIGGGVGGCGAFQNPIRLVGVSMSTLVRANLEQASLFSKDRRWRAATVALDAANNRYGDWAVQRASLLVSERVVRRVAAAFRATSHLKERR